MVMVENYEDESNTARREPHLLNREEELWLQVQELGDDLIEAVYERFHEAYETDDSRDCGEFRQLMRRYQAGNSDYRAGVDRAMVTVTGYRFCR